MIDIDRILSCFDGVRPSGGADKWIARCPAHQDKSPSLTISLTDDKVLLHCFGGCSFNEVLEASGLKVQDLFPERDRTRDDVFRTRLDAYRRKQHAQSMKDRLLIAQAEADVARGIELTAADLTILRDAMARERRLNQ